MKRQPMTGEEGRDYFRKSMRIAKGKFARWLQGKCARIPKRKLKLILLLYILLHGGYLIWLCFELTGHWSENKKPQQLMPTMKKEIKK
jgi:hypothetical protein